MNARRLSIRASPVLAALVLSSSFGCTRDREVTAPSTPHSIAAASSALPGSGYFYYYQGQPIQLDVDSSRIAVASDLQAPQAAIGEALSGLVPTGIERMPQLLDHWVVQLPAVSQSAFGAALARLAADARFSFASQVFRLHEDGSIAIPLNRLLLQARAGVTRASIDSLARALGLSVVREPKPEQGFLWYLLSCPARETPLQVAAALHGNPLVQLVEPDFVSDRRLMSAPTDPYYPLQYYLTNTVYLNGVKVDDNVEPAWDLTTGSGVKVAVIDAGIDGTHPELCGPHGAGYDAWPTQGEDAWHPSTLTVADMHGTAAAGIIAACQNNGIGIAGIAPSVTLISARIFKNGVPADADKIAAAINWAWSTAQADVLSNSWSNGAPSPFITDAINNAASQGRNGKGAAVIFAAGNSSKHSVDSIGSVLYPATLSAVLAVGAIDRYGYLTDYTPEGSKIGLVAPSGHYYGRCNSGDVVTLDLMGSPGCNYGPNGDVNYTGTFSGTSAAAPQVAAAAALLLALHPTMSWAEAAGRIAVNSDYWGPYTQYGAGKLNIYHILVPVAIPLSVTMSGPSQVRPNALCTWWAHPSGGVPPYSYSWIPSGTQVDSSVSEAFSVSSTLKVIVNDGQNTTAWKSKSITVSSSAPICTQ